MKKLIVLALFCMGNFARLDAQSIANTNWKGYFANPLKDTITWNIKTDSSFVTNSSGEVVVRSKITLTKDTLTISDVDGVYACQAMDGIYKSAISNNNLVLTLVADPCEGRSAVVSVKWIKVP